MYIYRMRWRQTRGASERLFVIPTQTEAEATHGWAVRILPPYGPKSSLDRSGNSGYGPAGGKEAIGTRF